MSITITDKAAATAKPVATLKNNRTLAIVTAIALICVLFAGVGYLGWLAYEKFKPRNVVLVDVAVDRSSAYSANVRRNAGGGNGQNNGNAAARADRMRTFGNNNNNFGGPNNLMNSNTVEIRPDALMSLGNQRYRARTGDALLDIYKAAVNGEWRFEFSYERDPIGEPERDALLMRRRIVSDPSVAKVINATPEQIAKLEALAPAMAMAVEDADIARMKELWVRYLAASASNAQQTVIGREITAALKVIADSSRSRTTASAVTRAAQVRSVLTPEQILKFGTMGRGRTG